MRLPIASPLVSRDGSANKDARLTNMLKEMDGSRELAVVRPGLVLDAVASGVGNGLVVFNDELVSVYGSTLYRINPFELISGDMPSDQFWSRPAWNGSVYCSVAAASAYAAISSDGLSWTRTNLPALRGWIDVAWNGVKFCAVASTVSNNNCANSADGITWVDRTLPTSQLWTSIIANPNSGVLIATSYQSTSAAVSSDDGDTWSSITIPTAGTWSVCSIDDTFLLAPQQFVSSGFVQISYDNGANWTPFAITGLDSNCSYSFSLFGDILFLLPSGYFTQSQTSTAFMSSDFGETWTTISIPNCERVQIGSGNGFRFVATASSYLQDIPPYAFAITTKDGTTWDTLDLPSSYYYSGASSNGSDFVLMGYTTNDVSVIKSEKENIGTVTDGRFDFAQSPI